MGITPNGKQLVIKRGRHIQIKGGKILEWWDFPDYLSLLTQAGAIPAPKKCNTFTLGKITSTGFPHNHQRDNICSFSTIVKIFV